MSPTKVTIVIVLGALVLGFGGCGMYGLNVVNSEVDLRNAVQAKSTSNEATLDTMWKIIKQKAEISQQSVSDIKEIYAEIVQGRKGGSLFKMVSEQYPDPEKAQRVYLDLMGSVEAERKTFKRDQQALVDLVRERKQLIDRPVSGMMLSFFGNKTHFLKKGDVATPDTHPLEFQYTWVTAKATKEMVESGEENDVELFKE